MFGCLQNVHGNPFHNNYRQDIPQMEFGFCPLLSHAAWARNPTRNMHWKNEISNNKWKELIVPYTIIKKMLGLEDMTQIFDENNTGILC